MSTAVWMGQSSVTIHPSIDLAAALVTTPVLHEALGACPAWEKWAKTSAEERNELDAIEVLSEALEHLGYKYRTDKLDNFSLVSLSADAEEWTYEVHAGLWAVIASTRAVSARKGSAPAYLEIYLDDDFTGFRWEFVGGVLLERKMEIHFSEEITVLPTPASLDA